MSSEDKVHLRLFIHILLNFLMVAKIIKEYQDPLALNFT